MSDHDKNPKQVPYTRMDGREVTRVEITCFCGMRILCGETTNSCGCGRDYGMGGSLLAPREQWGEETGEHPLDVLNGL